MACREADTAYRYDEAIDMLKDYVKRKEYQEDLDGYFGNIIIKEKQDEVDKPLF